MSYIKVTKDRDRLTKWVEEYIIKAYPDLHLNRWNKPRNNTFEIGVEFIEEFLDTDNFSELLEDGVIEIVS